MNGLFSVRLQMLILFSTSERLEHEGLTPLRWLGAPPEVMDGTLDFIDRTYGSVEDYLIRACDFGEDVMQQLRDSLAV